MPLPALLAVGAAIPIASGAMASYVMGWFRRKKGEFPVKKFREYIRDAYGKNLFSEAEVTDYWDEYVLGVVEKGLKPFDYRDNPTVISPEQQPIVEWLVGRLGGSVSKARAFGLALQTMATKGLMSRMFWDPLGGQEARKAAVEYAEVVAGPREIGPIEQGFSAVKWLGVGAAALGVAFVISKMR